MPDGGVTEFILAEVIEDVYAVAAAVAAYSTYVEIALVLAAAYQSYESAQRAKAAYNASLRDRYVMQRTSSGQRALVLGRARVSGPIAFMQSYGSNQSTLALVVVLAAHECDAIEKIYFNDQTVVLDGSGNVTGVLNTEHFSVNASSTLNVILAVPAQATTIVAVATYADGPVTLSTTLSSDNLHLALTGARAVGVADVKITYQPITCQYTPAQVVDQVNSSTATAATGSFTFATAGTTYGAAGGRGVRSQYKIGATSAASVVVVQTVGNVQTAIPFSVATDSFGNALSVSWSGATVGATVRITYQSATNASRARVRQYLGGPAQAADATLISNLPGEWTSAHVGTGLCYLVCEFDYDQSSFSAGLPNVSALVRGAKLFDPRTGTTGWTENPAILTRGYWTHALGANQPAATFDDTAGNVAANGCDPTLTFFLGLIPRSSQRYTAGLVVTKDQKPQDVLTDLCMAMGGRWVITGNVLRVKAGVYSSPVAAIDSTWLTGESAVTLQPMPPRQNLFNSVQGSFCDETNEYRAVLYPKQSASALITADGRELPLDITYAAVTKSGQAQYLSSCAIRYNRAGMTVRLACNLKAFALEVFDVVTLTLSRFGFTAQTFEVTDTSFTPEGLVLLTLKYITPSIWTLDPSYQITAYAPKTTFPSPWNVGVPVLGTPLTGPTQMLLQADGTAVSRIYVPITMTDVSVISGGFIDVSYIDAADTTGNWSTVTVSGDTQGVYLSPVKDGHVYQIKARARNTLYASTWSNSINTQPSAQSGAPTAVSGLSYVVSAGNVIFTWTPNTDTDYKQTAIQYGPVGTTGNAWNGSGVIEAFRGHASQFTWSSPGLGTYEVQVRHFNWSGVATASATISVAAPDRMSHIVSQAALTADWPSVSSTPANLAALSGTEAIQNGLINVGGRNIITRAVELSGANAATDYYGGPNAFVFTLGAGVNYRLSPFTVHDVGQYSISFWIKSSVATTVEFDICDNVNHTVAVTTSWQYVKVEGENNTSTYLNNTYFGFLDFNPTSACTLTVGNLMLEFANKASAWSPAPEDVTSGIAVAATTSTWTGVSGTGKPADNATADLVLIARGQCVLSGNTGTKVGGTGNWDSDIYSRDSYTGGAYASAVVPSTSVNIMFGLNSDPTTDQSYTSLDYAWYVSFGSYQIYENGSQVASGLTATNGDVLAIAYDGVNVSYTRNGVVVRSIGASSGLTLFWDSSFNTPGGGITNIRFGPLTSIAGVTAAAAAAATTANWATVSGTPANLSALTGTESLANADAASSLGFNPSFSVWSSTYPSGWISWGPSTPVKTTAYNTAGMQQGVQWTVTSADVTSGGSGMQAVWSTSSAPLPAGTVLTGSYSIQMLNGASQTPGYMIRLYTNAASTTYVDNWAVCPNPTVGGWQRVPFTATAGGAAIYGIRVYQMAGWAGFSSGMTPAGTSMVFGPFEFNIDLPVGYSQLHPAVVNDIADRLSKSAPSILSSTINLAAVAGAGFVAGSLTWNAAGARTGGSGVAMTPGGLVGTDSAGTVTFSIDASTGAATFGGQLTANGIVNTANLAANAVTNAIAFYQDLITPYSSSTSTTVATVTITTTGGPVSVQAGCNVDLRGTTTGPGGGTVTTVTVWVYRNPGAYIVLQVGVSGNTFVNFASPPLLDNPGAGTFTYTLVVGPYFMGGSAGISKRGLLVTELKR